MIEEEFVQFETSKLLKAAGFPQDDRYYARYNRDGQDWHIGDGYDYTLKPSQTLAMRWLREHEVVVIVDVEYFRYDIKNAKYRYNIYPNDCAKQTRSQYTYPTYEAAAEAGIQAACKYLIEEGGEA